MSIKDPKEYESLVDLIANNGPGRTMNAQQRRGSYWNNTLQIIVPKINIDNQYMKRGIGTGILLTKDGYFATNYHVLNPDFLTKATTPIIIKFPNKTTKELSEICVYSKQFDITIGKLKGHSVQTPTEVIFQTNPVNIKDKLRIYGFNDEDMAELTSEIATIGYHRNRIRNDTSRQLEIDLPVHSDEIIHKHSYTSDADVEDGFSGGAVVNENTGELIGMTYAGLDKTQKRLTQAEKLRKELDTRIGYNSGSVQESIHIFVSSQKIIDIVKIYLTKKIK